MNKCARLEVYVDYADITSTSSQGLWTKVFSSLQLTVAAERSLASVLRIFGTRIDLLLCKCQYSSSHAKDGAYIKVVVCLASWG
jgi:hypothetical protein